MDGCLELLGRAVDRSLAVTVSADGEEGAPACEGKFVRSQKGGGLWLQLSAASRTQIQRLVQAQAAARATFTMDGKRLAFETRLLRMEKHLWLNDRVTIEAVECEAPGEVRSVELRQWPRVLVSDSADLRGMLYRLPRSYVEASKTPEALRLKGKVWDLSRGGVSFVFAYERTVAEQFYNRMSMCAGLTFRGKRILLDCELRYHQRTMNGRAIRAGLAFEAREDQLLELDELLGRLRERQGLVGYRSPRA